MRRLVLALALSVFVLPSVGCSAQQSKGSASDKAFGDKVRAYLLEHPEVIQEAMGKLQAKEEATAAAVAQAALGRNRPALERDARDPVGGNAKGKVVLTEFFDYRCPYCKASAPELPALLKRHPDVRLVYKEFPILSPESDMAARLALAAGRQGKYEAAHQGLMKAPKLDDATTAAVLTQAGVDVAKARVDAQSPEITAQIADIHALGREIGVTGTPAFIVGDKVENGWSAQTLETDLIAAGSKPVG